MSKKYYLLLFVERKSVWKTECESTGSVVVDRAIYSSWLEIWFHVGTRPLTFRLIRHIFLPCPNCRNEAGKCCFLTNWKLSHVWFIWGKSRSILVELHLWDFPCLHFGFRKHICSSWNLRINISVEIYWSEDVCSSDLKRWNSLPRQQKEKTRTQRVWYFCYFLNAKF